MKLLKAVAVAIALLVAVSVSTAHAGVKSAAKLVGTAVSETNLVAAYSPGLSGSTAGLTILANYDVFRLTDKLSATVGVDIRSEEGWASQFGNLGIGGGLKYVVKGPFSVHAGYAQSLVGVPDGVSAGRAFVGIGIGKK